MRANPGYGPTLPTVIYAQLDNSGLFHSITSQLLQNNQQNKKYHFQELKFINIQETSQAGNAANILHPPLIKRYIFNHKHCHLWEMWRSDADSSNSVFWFKITEIEDLTLVVSWDQQFLNQFNKVLFSEPLAFHFLNEFKNCWSQETTSVRFFSPIITKIGYFKKINRVLSAVTANSKSRNALSNSGTLQVILNVSKDKDFSTRCSNSEIREVMWEINEFR